MKPNILCQLFDAFVGSILSYSSEVWGFTKSNEIEKVHLKFCKRILNVRLNASSAGIYGELSRYPLYIQRYYRIIKYWCNLKQSNNTIISKLYDIGLSDYFVGRTNWVSNVKKILDDYGFSNMFVETNNHVLKLFPKMFKQRVIDCFVQEWQGNVDRSSVLGEYRLFKQIFEYEKYLNDLPKDLRFYLTRFRIAAHSLRIQTGRYQITFPEMKDFACIVINKISKILIILYAFVLAIHHSGESTYHNCITLDLLFLSLLHK